MNEDDPVKDELDERKWLLLRSRIYEENVKGAFELFRKNGIEPILIKGWAIAREYPEAYRRVFGDLDLCVDPAQYRQAKKLVGGEEARRFVIDLHCGLDRFDTGSWPDFYQNSRIVSLDESQIRILRPEDHLRILIVHWLNDGGVRRDKLLDFFYLLENYREEFDWERFWGSVSVRRREWLLLGIKLVERYQETKLLPAEFEPAEVPGWVIGTIEKEWASAVHLEPLHTVLGFNRRFFRQLLKRVPPNPIQATVEMEGSFYHGVRYYYQLGSVLARLMPSLRRIIGVYQKSESDERK